VSDILIMTLGLLAGVVGCLAKPCRPGDWAHVKAARVEVEVVVAPTRVLAHDFDADPVSEPGFCDGLGAAAA
jgi:hypothetical protein